MTNSIISPQAPAVQQNPVLDLLLITPPWACMGGRGALQHNLPPLGLLSIAAYVEQHGYRVQIMDIHAERLNDQDVAARVAQLKPRYAGISVLTNTAFTAQYIARICKKSAPDCKVIAGGVHAEILPEEMLANSAIDAVGRGDGEELMLDVLRERPFPEIAGLSYRDGNHVVHNPPRPMEMDLDKYPFPAYHLINFKNYYPPVGTYRRLPAISMLVTRGCVGKCTFCNSARTILRTRSPEKVVEQIKLLRYRHGIRQIQFYDDTFTAMRKNVLAVCRQLVEERVDITWVAYIRGDCFSAEVAAAMKKAGCHQVLLGIETGDEQIMRTISKPLNREKYKEAVKIAHKFGLDVRASFILGLPGETRASMESSLQLAKDLDVDLIQVNILTPYPGTEIFNYAVRNGLLIHRNWNEYGQDRVLLNLPTVTAEEIYQFEKRVFRDFYMRPKVIIRQLLRAFSLRQLSDLFAAFCMLILGTAQKKPQSNCWLGLKMENFHDIPLENITKMRLTHEARQGKEFS
jgi:radical SAM superfamily enzyme YgiQ (UPF0313 family)